MPVAHFEDDDGDRILTVDTDSFIIGDTIWVGGTKRGKIAFLGETQFAKGEWAGVVLDDPSGKNDGTVSGIRYFQCEPLHGTFTRLTRLARKPLVPIDPSKECEVHGASPPRCLIDRQRSPSPYTGNAPSPGTGMNTPYRFGSPNLAGLKIGERVIVQSSTGTKRGVLRYIGSTAFAEGEWAGIELDQAIGKNDGTVQGKRYFQCPANHGLFAPLHKVSSSPANRRPSSSLRRHGSKESLASSVMSTASRTIRSARHVLREMEIHLDQLMQEKEYDRQELAQVNNLLAQRAQDDGRTELLKCMEELRSQVQNYKSEVEIQKNVNETLVQGLDELSRKYDDIQFSYDEEKILRKDLESQLESTLESELLPGATDYVQIYESQIKELQRSNEELVAKLQAAQQDAASIAERNDSTLIRNTLRFKSQVKDLEAKLASAQHNLASLSESKDAMMTQNTLRLESQIKTLELTIEEFQQRLTTSKNAEAVLAKTSESMLKEWQTQYESQIQELQLSIAHLQAKLSAAVEKETVLVQREEDSLREHEKYESDVKELNTKLAAAHAKEVALIESNKVAMSEKENIARQITELQMNAVQIQASTEAVHREDRNAESKSHAEELGELRLMFEFRIKELEAKLTAAEKNQIALANTSAESLSAQKKLESKINDLEIELDAARLKEVPLVERKGESLSVVGRNYESEIMNLEALVTASKRDAASAIERLNDVVDKNVKYKSHVVELELSKEELQSKLTEAQEKEIVQAQRNSESLSECRNKFESHIKDLEARLTESQENHIAHTRTNAEVLNKQKEFEYQMNDLEAILKAARENEVAIVARSGESLRECEMKYESQIHNLKAQLTSARENEAAMVENHSASLCQSEKKYEYQTNELHAQLSAAQQGADSVVESKDAFIAKMTLKFDSEIQELNMLNVKLQGKLKAAEETEASLVQNNEESLKVCQKEYESQMLGLQLAKDDADEKLAAAQKDKALHAANKALLTESAMQFESQIEELERMNETLQAEVTTSQTARDILVKSNQELLNELKTKYESHIQELEHSNDNLTAKLVGAQTSVTTLVEDRCAFLTENLEKYEFHVKELQMSKELLQAELTATQEKEIVLAKSHAESLSECEKKYEFQIKDYVTKLAEAQKSATSLIANRDAVLSEKNESQMKEFQLTKERLQVELTAAQAKEIAVAKSHAESLSECEKKYEFQIKDYVTKLAEAQKSASSLIANRDAVLSEKSMKNESLMKELQLSKERLQAELTAAQEKEIALAQRNAESLSECEKKYESQIKDLELRLQSLRSTAQSVTALGAANMEDSRPMIELDQNIQFLNSIIVDLKQKNEELNAKVDILISGEVPPDHNRNIGSSVGESLTASLVSSRPYCDICEEFDLHDTEDCPTQCSVVETNSQHHEARGASRKYCDNCEVFGHSTEDCDDGETF